MYKKYFFSQKDMNEDKNRIQKSDLNNYRETYF